MQAKGARNERSAPTPPRLEMRDGRERVTGVRVQRAASKTPTPRSPRVETRHAVGGQRFGAALPPFFATEASECSRLRSNDGRCGGEAESALVHYADVRTRHGCQDLEIPYLDERLAKAFSHRLRVRILQRLTEAGEASPSELADVLGEQLGNISYHVRVLRPTRLPRARPHRAAPRGA